MRNVLLACLFSLISTIAFATNNVDLHVNYTIHNNTGQSLIVSSIWTPRCHWLTLLPQLQPGNIIPVGDTVLVGYPEDENGGYCSYNFVTNDNGEPKGRIAIQINADRLHPGIEISQWGNLSFFAYGIFNGEITISKK